MFTIVAVCAIAACSDDCEPTRVSVVPHPWCESLALGDSTFLMGSADSETRVGLYTSAERPSEFSWTTSDSSILSVSPLGLAHARAQGTATVTARLKDMFGSAELHVVIPSMTASVSPTSPTLDVDDTVFVRTRAFDAQLQEVAPTNVLISTFESLDSPVHVSDHDAGGAFVAALHSGLFRLNWAASGRCGVVAGTVR